MTTATARPVADLRSLVFGPARGRQPARRFLALEGLRGVAALAVVVGHLGGWGLAVFSHFYLAVDLFFIMSGVVIALDNRLRSGWSAAAFMGARVRRLAPLYLLGAVLGAVCSLLAHRLGYGGDGPLLANLFLALLFIPVLFGSGDLYPLNAPSWSLFAEMGANLAYGATARTLSRATLVLLTLLGAAAVVIVTLRCGTANVGVSAGNLLGGIARVGFGFSAGVLVHRLHASGRLRVPRLPAWLALAIAAASFAIPCRSPIYDLVVILALYPALIAAVFTSPVDGRVSAAAFAAAGAVSYPLYALHYPLAKLAGLFLPRAGVDSMLAVLLCGAGLVLLAYGAWRGFDQPLQAWLKGASPAPARIVAAYPVGA
jgi:peptidoglycan/LPS O-acetylase OafA/YrhL